MDIKRQDVETIILKLKSLPNKLTPKLMKKRAVLIGGLLLLSAAYFTKHITDERLKKQIKETIQYDGVEYQIDSLINRMSRGEISTDNITAEVFNRIRSCDNENNSFIYDKGNQVQVFNMCNQETIDKLKELDATSDWFSSTKLRNPENMHVSDYAIAVLTSIEKLELNAYQLKGERYHTIGYGHFGSDVKPDMKITPQQADKYLRKDLEKTENQLKRICSKWAQTGNFAGLTQDMFDAIVLYMYNRGREPFADGSMLTAELNSLKTSDYDKCYKWIMTDTMEDNSKYYSTVTGDKADQNSGWRVRRALEAELFKGNKYNFDSIFTVPKRVKKSGILDGYPEISRNELLIMQADSLKEIENDNY